MAETELTPHVVVEHAARPCAYCRQPIALAWLEGRKGRRMPIDLQPDPAGNVAVRVAATGQIIARVLSSERPVVEGGERPHLPHFATCGKTASPGEQPPPWLARAAAARRAREARERDPWRGV